MLSHRRFFTLLLIFLPTQLGYHVWPDWSMVLGRRVDYLAPTVYLTDILLFAVLLSWFLEVLSEMKNYELRIKGRAGKLFSSIIHNSRFIILFLGFIAVNIFIAQNRYVAVYKWIKVAEFVALGWYIVKTRPSLSTVVTPLSIGVLYSSILAIAQFLLQHSIGGPLWWLGERTFTADTPGIARFESCPLSAVRCQLFLRPYATFPHPNVLGGFLAVALPLLLQAKKSLPRRQAGKWIYLSFCFGVIALILTFSRSAWIIGVIAIVLTIMKKRTIVFYVVIFAVLIAVLVNFNPLEESTVVRQQLNDAALTLWQQSPLAGVGLGNFLVRLPEVLPSRTIYFLQPVHNIYLLLLAEVGIVGIGFIVFYVATLLKHESRIMTYGEDKTKFIIHNSLFVLLLLGLVDHYPLTVQQGQLLLTVFVALSYASRPSSS